MMVTLDSGRLRAKVDALGAQLTSVEDRAGAQYIWQGDSGLWGRHAPNLFPFIGRLKGGKYTANGVEYTISTHGFARDLAFEVVEQGPARACFRLTDTEETRKCYPFAFSLTIAYTLEDNRLRKTYTVENRSEQVMFYEVGGHDGYCVPPESDDWAVLLPGLDALRPYGMNGDNLVTPKAESFPLEGGRVSLTPSSYGLDTVILDQLPRRRASLADGRGQERVRVDFSDFPYLGLWTPCRPSDTRFVCIEPWSSLPDAVFVGRGVEEKAGVRRLPVGGVEALSYTVTFFERSKSHEA